MGVMAALVGQLTFTWQCLKHCLGSIKNYVIILCILHAHIIITSNGRHIHCVHVCHTRETNTISCSTKQAVNDSISIKKLGVYYGI